MAMIQGVVQALAKDPTVFNTAYGPAYHLKFKMHDGQWYKFPFCKPDEEPPVHKGMTVAFDFDVDQRQNNRNPNGPMIIDNVVVKKSFINLGGGGMSQQYQQPQQQYQQQQYQQPQQQYQPPQQQQYQPPQQQQYQQQKQPPAHNWVGKEGMSTGVALRCAATMTTNPDEIIYIAAKIMLVQDEMIKFLESGGHPQQIIDANPKPASGATQQTAAPVPPAGGQTAQQQPQQDTGSQQQQAYSQPTQGTNGMPAPPPANVNNVSNPATQVPYSQAPSMVPNQNMAG